MRGRNATGHWRRICATLLCLALTEPALSAPDPTHSTVDHAPSSVDDSAMPDDHGHGGSEIAPADHCHPGLDCFFQAIVTVLDIPEPLYDVGQLSGAASDKGRKGTMRGFDPPPPRRLS